MVVFQRRAGQQQGIFDVYWLDMACHVDAKISRHLLHANIFVKKTLARQINTIEGQSVHYITVCLWSLGTVPGLLIVGRPALCAVACQHRCPGLKRR